MMYQNYQDIRRGDIYFVEGSKNPIGSEQAGTRPAVIVSNDTGNKHSPNVEVVFLTSKQKKPLPTHVSILCKVPSIAMCENVETVSKERLSGFVRSCTANEMKAIDLALLCSLGISTPSTPLPSPQIEETNDTNIELRVYKTLYEQLLDRIVVKA